jgi:hypothetical protein
MNGVRNCINGILFDLKSDGLTRYELMRDLHSTQFKEPGRVNKDDYKEFVDG